jgi:hypothetical protein
MKELIPILLTAEQLNSQMQSHNTVEHFVRLFNGINYSSRRNRNNFYNGSLTLCTE